MGRIRVYELRPLAFQLCTMALIVGELALQCLLPVLAAVFPEHGRAIMILSRLLVAASGLPMLFRAAGHGPKV